MGMYGLGAAIGAGLQGYRQGKDWQEGNQDQQHQRERQQVTEQRQDTQYEQQQSDRQEFALPAQRAEASSRETAIKRDQMRRALSQAAARKDLAGIASIYNDGVDDGHTAELQWTPDGKVQIKHSSGQTAVVPFEDVVWGKQDGTGLGLWDMLDPDHLAARRDKGADRTAKMEDSKLDYGMRADLAKTEYGLRAQEISQQGAQQRELETLRGGQSFADDAGNMYMLRPDGTAKPVAGPDGAPMKAPTYGMPSGRGGRGAGGTTADITNNRYAAEMAIKADASGALAKLPPGQVESMVYQARALGKDRIGRQKLLASLLGKAMTNNKFASPAELGEQVRALDGVIENQLGPPPPLGPSATGGGFGDEAADDNDPLGLR